MKLDTCTVERKKGQHLQREERGAIQQLKNAGYTNRAIARAIGCSPTTVGNELKRGTPLRKSSKGRKPGYSARRGEAAYKANRKRSRKPHRICHCTRFIRWIIEQVKEHKWSLDACVGYARLHKLFSAEEMVCTHTLYNEVWAGNLDLSVTELPEAMKRKQHKDSKPREHRKSFGTDISQRPEIAALRIEEGHWEGDTFSQVFKDHYRGQRLGVLCVQSGRELGLCSLLCASLHLVGTSPKRKSQRAVSNLRSEGRVHRGFLC